MPRVKAKITFARPSLFAAVETSVGVGATRNHVLIGTAAVTGRSSPAELRFMSRVHS